MCDPTGGAATAMMAIASASSAAIQGGLAYAEGQATNKAYQQAAKQELMNTAVEETAYRKEARKFASKQRVQALASGGDVSSGSIDQVLSEDVETMELNALMRRYAGETEAENLRFQGSAARRKGQIGLVSGFMEAGIDALGSNARGDFDVFKKKAA